MPIAQVREIFKPSFSVSVPPGAEFGAATPQPNGGSAAPGVDTTPMPPNTYEVGPSARKTVPSGPNPAAPATMAVAPAGPLAGAPSTAPANGPAQTTAAATVSSPPGPTSIEAASGHKSGGTLDSVKGLFELR